MLADQVLGLVLQVVQRAHARASSCGARVCCAGTTPGVVRLRVWQTWCLGRGVWARRPRRPARGWASPTGDTAGGRGRRLRARPRRAQRARARRRPGCPSLCAPVVSLRPSCIRLGFPSPRCSSRSSVMPMAVSFVDLRAYAFSSLPSPSGPAHAPAARLPRMSSPPVVAVVGPTAAGKSDLGVELARRLGGEVVNADSMQLYEGMDIGTAKLHAAERARRPAPPAGRLGRAGDRQRRRVPAAGPGGRGRARRRGGCPPILVGGSGLYVRAVLDDMRFPGTDADVRARLEAELAAVGPGALHERLAPLDPAAAATDPARQRPADRPGAGGRRAHRRAVHRERCPSPRYVRPAVQVGLEVPRDVLDARITARVDVMWAAGLVAEVEAPRRARAARGAHRVPRPRLRAGAARPGRRVGPSTAARAETVRATRRVRPPAGVLVRPGRPRAPAGLRRPAAARRGARGRRVGRPAGAGGVRTLGP